MLIKNVLQFRYKLYFNLVNKIQVRNTSQSSVGFIGLGNMGSNMAQNLLNKGHRLVVYDVYPEAMAALADKGALIAHSPADVANKCDRIISMLPTCAHVRQVYCGDNGVLSQVKTGTLLIDSSTIDPQTSQQMASEAQTKGAVFLDAPVSGAVPAARAATLTFMVGGNAIEVEAIKDLLLSMGKNVFHCGPVGTGAVAKICNNMMLAISMIGLSETLNLAKNLGLEPQLMTKILNVSSGRSWSSEVYNPVPGLGQNLPAGNEYKGGFMTQLITKDLGLAQSSATRVNSPTPLGTLSHQIYRLMKNNGYSDKDFSSVYKFFQDFDQKS
ncbi:3-hydroxyisobutyrate dehydrogenase, mitochondrial-like [Oppia nitens]|uniref:3-hydroxyisobutyrate dehydrogenase, mitochondrial-like n=1 Tax=Oppia nitens TaxID=1686743 RepID=UPI0023DAF0A1|nr:3-hydroxyisobutyrate dehydrogenase, mitochondrial-like [Oppia nitens]